jgi:hypothetical protein
MHAVLGVLLCSTTKALDHDVSPCQNSENSSVDSGFGFQRFAFYRSLGSVDWIVELVLTPARISEF